METNFDLEQTSDCLDFELEIGVGNGRRYPIHVIRSVAGEAHETMHFPFSPVVLENRLLTLQKALISSGGKFRRAPSAEEQTVQNFGQALFEALFVGEVRSRYAVSQREAVLQRKGLRVKLRIQSPQLATVPWEFLYDVGRAEYVCLSRNTPIIRYIELPHPPQPFLVTLPLRILVMIVSPRDISPLDIEREKLRIERATELLRDQGLVSITWLQGQTWQALQHAMRQGPWHIFHFIGHGGFNNANDEGFIALADSEGYAQHLSATHLSRLLFDQHSLRLVVLNSCEGARGSKQDTFSSTASILIQRGIPAVLAMQYEITDLAAIELSRTFYDALAEGMPVDMAVGEARKAISLGVNTIEWGTPVLYMRSPNGMLFNIKEHQVEVLPSKLEQVVNNSVISVASSSTQQNETYTSQLKEGISSIEKKATTASSLPLITDTILISAAEVPRQVNEHMTIDMRISDSERQENWRFYISHVLHIALNILSEDHSDDVVGILLPLDGKQEYAFEVDTHVLSKFGGCLIGWRGQDGMFHTFYESAPSFDYPSDFRVRGLRATEEEELNDHTLIIIRRNAKVISPSLEVVKVVRQLLNQIYEEKEIWLPYFQSISLITASDGLIRGGMSILSFASNMIIRLGGRDVQGKDRWKFCCILLPRDSSLPLQMHSLVVQAQSDGSPHIINKTSVSPDVPILSLSLRAYQSGHVLFRSSISLEDKTIVYHQQEMPIKSAIAVPIGGEYEYPLGVLYVVSEQEADFRLEDQRVLRLMSRMIGELLKVVHIRQQSNEQLHLLIERPQVVNRTLEGFGTENEFIGDVDELLRTIGETNNPLIEGYTSFIGVDIDNATEFASKFGDHVLLSLSKELASRIQEMTRFLSGTSTDCQIYHAYSDRFYILLNNMSLMRTREVAEKLRLALNGSYLVSLLPITIETPIQKIELRDVTVRLSVLSYTHAKFYETLNRYPIKTKIADVSSTVLYFLETSLNMGKQQGGNCIISYYPPEPPKYSYGRIDLWNNSQVRE